MSLSHKAVAVPLSAVALLVGEVLAAAHRRDLPGLSNQDPSGVFGSPDLRPLRVVALGDSSITAPGVDPLDACWVRRLANHISDRHRVELISVAVGGSKARNVLAEQIDAAIDHEPDVCIVSVGANDAVRATPVARYEDELNQIVHALHDVSAGVLVSGIGDLGVIPRLPTPGRAYCRIRGRSFDRAVARVVSRYSRAHKTATWGALWEPFAHHEETGVFAPDLFHASAEGHRIFAHAAIPVMERILAERRAGAGSS